MRQERTSSRRKSSVSEKVRRKKHALRTSRSDDRRRDEGLTRISIWVPVTEARQIAELARELVTAHRARVAQPGPTLIQGKVEIPKPWRDPLPRDDHRQQYLPF